MFSKSTFYTVVAVSIRCIAEWKLIHSTFYQCYLTVDSQLELQLPCVVATFPQLWPSRSLRERLYLSSQVPWGHFTRTWRRPSQYESQSSSQRRATPHCRTTCRADCPHTHLWSPSAVNYLLGNLEDAYLSVVLTFDFLQWNILSAATGVDHILPMIYRLRQQYKSWCY